MKALGERKESSKPDAGGCLSLIYVWHPARKLLLRRAQAPVSKTGSLLHVNIAYLAPADCPEKGKSPGWPACDASHRPVQSSV